MAYLWDFRPAYAVYTQTNLIVTMCDAYSHGIADNLKAYL